MTYLRDLWSWFWHAIDYGKQARENAPVVTA